MGERMGKTKYTTKNIDWISLSGYVNRMAKEAKTFFEYNIFLDQEVQEAFLWAMEKSDKYTDRIFKQKLKEIDKRRLKEESEMCIDDVLNELKNYHS